MSRVLPPALAAAYASGVTTLSWCWIATRRDGVRIGFTDHDRDLAVDGVLCRAGAGLEAGTLERTLDLAADQSAVVGAFSSDALSETDLRAGRWDAAQVEIWRVDWTKPAHGVCWWTGRIGAVRWSGARFEAELIGLEAALDVEIGRVFARRCDAELGDARCGASLTIPGRAATGAVTAVGDGWVAASGLGALTLAHLVGGVARLESGAAVGLSRRILSAAPTGGSDVRLMLADGFTPAPAPGDELRASVGCDKSWETCVASFSNGARFRGFPHMPGNDAIQRGPAA